MHDMLPPPPPPKSWDSLAPPAPPDLQPDIIILEQAPSKLYELLSVRHKQSASVLDHSSAEVDEFELHSLGDVPCGRARNRWVYAAAGRGTCYTPHTKNAPSSGFWKTCCTRSRTKSAFKTSYSSCAKVQVSIGVIR